MTHSFPSRRSSDLPCVAEQELGIGPSPVFLAYPVRDRHADVVEEDIVDLVRTVEGDDRPDRDAGRRHIDQKEGDALLRLPRGVGAHERETPVGALRESRPGLVAVHDIMVAFAPRSRADIATGSTSGAT